jgi:uncharacterized membrane protein YphA (DoxX/SURF4 family)
MASLLLRLSLGTIFILHGYEKVKDAWGTRWEESLEWLQPVVAWTEIVCGGAIVLGFLTRLSALGLACVMLGAVYVAWQGRGFGGEEIGATVKFGYLRSGAEFPFALLAQSLATILLGGGAFSVDYCIRRARGKSGVPAAAHAAVAPPHGDAVQAPAGVARH